MKSNLGGQGFCWYKNVEDLIYKQLLCQQGGSHNVQFCQLNYAYFIHRQKHSAEYTFLGISSLLHHRKSVEMHRQTIAKSLCKDLKRSSYAMMGSEI